MFIKGKTPFCDSFSRLLVLVCASLEYDCNFMLVIPRDFPCIVDYKALSNLVAISRCTDHGHPLSGSDYFDHTILIILFCKFSESASYIENTCVKGTMHATWFIWSVTSMKAPSVGTCLNSTHTSRVFLFTPDVKLFQLYRAKNANVSSLKPVHHLQFRNGGKRQMDLEGSALRVTAVMDDEYSFDTKIVLNSYNETKFQPSFAVDLLWALQERLNFRIKIQLANGWGYFNELSQKWEGMISDLLSDKADIAISSSSILPFRQEAVDFNMATTTLNLAGFFKKSAKTVDSGALLDPFQNKLWVGLASWVGFVWLALTMFKLIIISCIDSRSDGKFLKYERDTLKVWCTMDSILWTVSILSCKSFYYVPRYACYRIGIAAVLLSSIVINGYYSGTLVSFLSVEVESLRTFESLVASTFTFAISTSPIPRKLLKESSTPEVRQVYNENQADLKFENIGEAKESILHNSVVFFNEDVSTSLILQSDFSPEDGCKIRKIKVPFAKQGQSSMLPKSSQLKRPIDHQILWFKEIGLVRRWTNLYIPKPMECSELPEMKGIQLKSVTVAYKVLISGIFTSISILIVEYLLLKVSCFVNLRAIQRFPCIKI